MLIALALLFCASHVASATALEISKPRTEFKTDSWENRVEQSPFYSVKRNRNYDRFEGIASESSVAPRVAGIAGDAPKVRSKLNPNGLVRSEDEILDVLRRGGVEIPDDVAIFVGEADEFVGTLDDLLAGRNALTARMPSLTEDAAGYVHFNHMYNRFGKIPVRINPSMMASDDAILAVMKHELHELGLFREVFRRGNGRMTFDAFRAEAMPGNPGNYHWQAWDAADDLILWWRGLK